MPLEPHPTDPDKLVYASRHYDIPQLQGVTTTQRTWVDLTDAELAELSASGLSLWALWRAILAKSKEKNNG